MCLLLGVAGEQLFAFPLVTAQLVADFAAHSVLSFCRMKEIGGAREYFDNSYVGFGKEHVSCFRAIPATGKGRAEDTLHVGRDSIFALCYRAEWMECYHGGYRVGCGL